MFKLFKDQSDCVQISPLESGRKSEEITTASKEQKQTFPLYFIDEQKYKEKKIAEAERTD